QDGPAPFGAASVLLYHAGDLKGGGDDTCEEDCLGRDGPRHHHFLVDVGPAFLGVLEQFAQAGGDGVRRYVLPVGGANGAGPALRAGGKTGRLVTVYLPAEVGEPAACRRLTGRQRRLLQAVVRETTRRGPRRRTRKRTSRQDHPAVAEPEVFPGNLVKDSRG